MKSPSLSFKSVAVCSLLVLPACVSPIDTTIETTGFVECFRLDREPFEGEDDDVCTDATLSSTKTGTFHRQSDLRLDAEVLPLSIPPDLARKLPLSDCLWGSASQSGNGDEFAPVWEAETSWSADNRAFFTGVSSCRLDPVNQRVPIATVRTAFDCRQLRQGSFTFSSQHSLGEFKAFCDAQTSFLGIDLVAHPAVIDSFGSCGEHQATSSSVPGFVPEASDCAAVVTVPGAPEQSTFVHTTAPRGDVQYVVQGSGIGHALSPAIRTVVDKRLIARPLTLNATGGSWQTPVTSTSTNGSQRWHENFLSTVIIEDVRVFALPDLNSTDREYLSMENSELRIVDPTTPNETPTCLAEDNGNTDDFDVSACGIMATPTYRMRSLEDASTALVGPLQWHIDSDQIVEDGRLYFIEFDLNSVYRSRQAALRADATKLDFGRASLQQHQSQFVRVTNDGYDRIVIDQAAIDPHYGEPTAFKVYRLDDPVYLPMPAYLEPTGKPNEYIAGLENTEPFEALVELHEYPSHEELAYLDLDGEFVELGENTLLATGEELTLMSSVVTPIVQGGPRRYPITQKLYTLWSLPFLLEPGQSRTLSVKATPFQWGLHKGRLNVSAYVHNDPSVRVSSQVELVVDGAIGPQATVAPTAVRLPMGSSGDTYPVLVVSYGDADVERYSHELIDTDYAQHAGEHQFFSIDPSVPSSSSIAPGASEAIRITYDPGCFAPVPVGGTHQAVLRLETNTGEIRVPVSGNPEFWAALNGHCLPH